MKLSQRKCLPCSGSVKALENEKLEEFLPQILGWEINADRKLIFKEFKFKNFLDTFNFVSDISRIAEDENHHPNIEFTWGYCKISIQTHKINALSEADFILAAKIDKVSAV